MQKYFLYLTLLLLITSQTACSSARQLSSLNPQERSRIDELLSQRKLCLVDKIQSYDDDGQTDLEYVVQSVSYDCGRFIEKIKDTLYADFNVDLGEAWSYSNDLRQKEGREIKEAVILRRKAMRKGNDPLNIMRKSN